MIPTFANYTDGIPGKRTDGKHLINDWKNMKSDRVFVANKADLMNINVKLNQQVLGVFDSDHCTYNLEVKEKKLEKVKPSLAEMTQKAIEVLSQNKNGFFLLVEGGSFFSLLP